MPKTSNRVLSHLIIYLGFDFINKAIPFLLIPYLTRRLPVQDFGTLELFNTYLALLTILVMFGMDGWSSANFHKLEPHYFAQQLRLGLRIMGCMTVLSAMALPLLVDRISFLWSAIYAALLCIVYLRALLFRLQFKTLKASLLLFANILTSTILTVAAFEWGHASFEIRLMALLIPAIGLGIWSFRSLWKDFDPDVSDSKPAAEEDFSHLKQLLRFTVPLLPNGLINFVRFGADKFVVAKYFGIAPLAVFSVGYQFSMIANIFMLSLSQATVPFFMKLLKERRPDKYKKLGFQLYAGFLFFLMVLYGTSPYLIENLFDEKYHSALTISNKYLISYLFVFLYILMVNVLYFLGETRKILFITSVASLSHALLLFFLIRRGQDIMSIPVAFQISSIVSFLVTWLMLSISDKNLIRPLP